jgi:CMP/dCMP kinase
VITETRALRIAISSHSGCGNPTATDNVGKSLLLDVVNYTFRDLAKDLDIRFEEIQQKADESRPKKMARGDSRKTPNSEP